MIQFVNETTSYNTDDIEFAVFCVGAAFLVLLLLKWWRA